MSLKQFLKQALPNEGYKCWVEINGGKVLQGFTESFDALENKLIEIDSRGVDAYFACSSFETPQSRRAGNALSMQSFWADVDVGEGKPYATADEAISACDAFCHRSQIDVPGVVRSGGGIHIYWILDHTLHRTQWLPVAQRLKLLMASQGFHADPSRTADPASILRAPGTCNYKIIGHPRRVELGDWADFAPIPCSEFIETIINIPLGSVPQNIKNPQKSLNADLIGGLAKGFDATTGTTPGNRGITCLKYAGGLVAKGHSEEEVLAMCLEWNNLCTPPQDEKEVRRIIRSVFTMEAAKHAEIIEIPVTALPKLPNGYRWDQFSRMVAEEQDEETGKIHVIIVAPYPCYLAAVCRKERNEIATSYMFHAWHPQEGWREFFISSKEFQAPGWYGDFSHQGGLLRKGAEKYFHTYVRIEEERIKADAMDKIRYNQFGWKDNRTAFLVGDVLIRQNAEAVSAHGDPDLQPFMEAMKLPEKGSRAVWSQSANKLFQPSMESYGFTLLCSFAAPLMTYCVGNTDGGAILALHSDQSGRGKSTIAEAISSVWGNAHAIRTTGNFTVNRQISDITRLCNIPMVEEELTERDPLIAADRVKKFTVGQDRGRLNRSGGAAGKPATYQTMLISISNNSLSELVKMSGDQGAAARIFELSIAGSNSKIFDNFRGIAATMLANCGFAGREFIHHLLQPGMDTTLKNNLDGTDEGNLGTLVKYYRKKIESRPEHRYIVWVLSCCHFAAVILNKTGILHLNVDHIMNWAVEQAKIRQSYGTAPLSIEYLNAFINEHALNCVVVEDVYNPKKGACKVMRTPQRSLTMRQEYKGQRLYLTHELLRDWCHKKSISFSNLISDLTISKVVLRAERITTLGAGTDFPSGRVRCIEVDTGHPDISGQVRIMPLLDVEQATAL